MISTARTSYNDLRGTISIDFPGDLGRTEFDNYAESIGIDLSKYQPQGFEIYGAESFEYENISVSIYAIDIEKREEYSKKNNGKVPVVLFKHIDTLPNLFQSLHRISIVLMKGHAGDSNDPENLTLIEEIDL